jgi:3-hydroxyacyl-CoA dehydrogenase/3-hydroxy-2-methylbutyryl-CoA dehydrogenase
MNIPGKVALVAGATSRLSLATARELSGRGAKVAVLGRRGALARDIAASLQNEAIGIEADIADDAAVAAAVRATVERVGALHITVTTAGIIDSIPVIASDGSATPAGDLERMLKINLVGTFSVMTHSVSAMLRNDPDDDGERGVVITTSSDAAYDGSRGQTACSAIKAGIIALSLPASRDLAGTGIRVNSIVAGGFDTPILAGIAGTTTR